MRIAVGTVITLALLTFSDLRAIGAEPAAVRRVSEPELAEKLRSYRGISDLGASFKQVKWIQDMGVSLSSEGKLRMHFPDTVDWEITKPSHVRVELHDGHIHLESGSGGNLNRQDLNAGDLPDDRAARALTGLVAWLTLDAKRLTEQYQVLALGAETFRFVPKETDSAIFKDLEMELSPQGYLKRLVIHEISQDRLEIEFGKPVIK